MHQVLCPDCEAGLEAREQLWQQDFFFPLFALLAPFVIVALLGLLLGRAFR
jgi:hypothetical protein